MTHPEFDSLLKIVAVVGTLLGLAGLLVALIALRKKRQSDNDFTLLADANVALGKDNATLRFEAEVMNRVHDALLPAATAQSELTELRKLNSDLDTGLAAAMDDRDKWRDKYHASLAEGAIVDEIDDSTAVITSAPPNTGN